MAYIIPSKNIFDVTHNKLIDNKITAVEITEKSPQKKKVNFSKKIELFKEENIAEDTFSYSANLGTLQSGFSNGGATSIYSWFWENAEGKYTAKIDLEDYILPSSIRISFSYDLVGVYGTINSGKKTFTGVITEEKTVDIEDYPPLTSVNSDYIYISRSYHSVSPKDNEGYVSITSKISFNNKYDVDDYLGEYPVNNISVDLYFDKFGTCPYSEDPKDTQCSIIRSITLYIYADAIDISSTETKVIGSEKNDKILRLEENEFPASYEILPSNTTAMEEVANRIIHSYKNGRETATVVCGISNFISSDEKRDLFKIGDIVIPCLKINNCETAMSHNSRAYPKSFLVANSKKFFDGEFLQELSLIEGGIVVEEIIQEEYVISKSDYSSENDKDILLLKEGLPYSIEHWGFFPEIVTTKNGETWLLPPNNFSFIDTVNNRIVYFQHLKDSEDRVTGWGMVYQENGVVYPYIEDITIRRLL